jgi:undecaprenyl-diphosphatase
MNTLGHLVTHTPNPISTFQAIVLGVLQGATELFPVSSLGHTVLFPNLFGWHTLVKWQSQPESPWLAFIVMLHVGSAIGLLVYFWRDWIAIIGGGLRTLKTRRIETANERLAWLIVAATIPWESLASYSSTPSGSPWPSRSRRRSSWS